MRRCAARRRRGRGLRPRRGRRGRGGREAGGGRQREESDVWRPRPPARAASTPAGCRGPGRAQLRCGAAAPPAALPAPAERRAAQRERWTDSSPLLIVARVRIPCLQLRRFGKGVPRSLPPRSRAGPGSAAAGPGEVAWLPGLGALSSVGNACSRLSPPPPPPHPRSSFCYFFVCLSRLAVLSFVLEPSAGLGSSTLP